MENQKGAGFVYISLILIIVGTIVYIGITLVKSIKQTVEVRQIRSAGLELVE